MPPSTSHPVMITPTHLKSERFWTDTLIRRYLGPLDERHRRILSNEMWGTSYRFWQEMPNKGRNEGNSG